MTTSDGGDGEGGGRGRGRGRVGGRGRGRGRGGRERVEGSVDAAAVGTQHPRILPTEHFFTFHDPTTKDRQGNDAGTQYASVIFAHDPEQRATAERVREEVRRRVRDGRVRTYANPDVVTQVVDAADYFPASEAHQRYLEKRPDGYCNHRRRFAWVD